MPHNPSSILRNAALLLLLPWAFAWSAQAQVSTGGVPYGLRAGLATDNLPTVRAEVFDPAAVAVEDAARAAQGKVPAYSRILGLHAGLDDAGEWMELPGSDRLWRLRVASGGALATELYFADFHMPDNGSLFVYSEDGTTTLGGFTAYNNSDDGGFTTSLIPGETCILEYYEPAAVAGEGRLELAAVGHAYRFVEGWERAVGACEVDVNCSEGSAWQEQRDAVVRISIVEGGFGYWCSGALVNNLDEDCKPYFLTAQHCYEGSSQSELNQWKFYFNYEKSGCGSGASPSNHTVTGCYKRGASNDGGGNSGSDFLLVEGKTTIPQSYNPYWAGWDASGTGSTSGVSIHHPDGDRKKISTYSASTVSDNWNGPQGTHWRVRWVATANGHGVTEEGSSGSPLFNSGKQLIGTLTGGTSSCSNTNGYDWYGKTSYHWQSNPGAASFRLKNFLDPQGTGTVTMEGSYDPCGLHVAVAELEAPVRLEVRPNPAGETALVRIPTEARTYAMLRVFDMAGKEVRSLPVQGAEELRLNTVGLENGAYFLRLATDREVVATAPLIVLQP